MRKGLRGFVVVLAAVAAGCLVDASFAAERQLQIVPTRSAPSGEKRVALVIGNSGYKSAPLRNPVNDARAISKALAATGFKVTVLEDATQATMVRSIREFGDELTAGGVGLFYYAGHGIQVRGRNFLVPVNADIQREDEVEFNAVDANFVVAKMDTAKNGLNLLILDACRNNPFQRSFRSSTQGLAQMDAPSGTLVAFATAPGSVAADGDGANGLYTKHLLANLAKPGLPIEQLFKEVRNGVARDTGERQIPWESSSLRGNFFFVAPDPSQSPEAQKLAMEKAIAEAVKREQSKLAVERAQEQLKMQQTIRELLAKQRAELEEQMRQRAEKTPLEDAAPARPAQAPRLSPAAETISAPPVPAATASTTSLNRPPTASSPAALSASTSMQVATIAPSTIAGPASSNPRFPGIGDYWVYAYVDTFMHRRTARFEITGVSEDGILETRDFGDGKAVPQAHSSAALIIFDQLWEFSPYMLSFIAPKAGDVWRTIPFKNLMACQMVSATCRFDGKVLGNERLTTPAGTFDTTKVLIEMNARGLGTGSVGAMLPTWRHLTLWYSEQAKRVVKATARTLSPSGSLVDYDLELIEYKLN